MQSRLLKTNQAELSADLIGKLTGISPKDITLGINWLVINPIQGKNIGIDEIRMAASWLNTTQINTQIKILQINSADLMTNEAQNSLLKLLEEPGNNNQILLVSRLPDQLLPTVLSRCQLITLADKPQLSSYPTELEMNQVNRLINQTPTQAIVSIEEEGITKNQSLITKLLFNFIYCCQKNIITHSDTKKLSQLDRLKIIRLASRSLEMLEANVNPRLVIETFLLDLPPGH